MEVRLNKFTGALLLNLVRQVALTRLSEVRPIAFKVGGFSNVVNISDNVEEDMTEFISNVCYYKFNGSANSTMSCVALHCNGALDISSFNTSEISVASGERREVLHSFSDVPVIVYFRNGSGKFTAEENERFLQEQGISTEDLVVINSRHRPVFNIGVEQIDEDESEATYRITVYDSGKLSDAEVLQQSLDWILSDLKVIKGSVDAS